MITFNQALIKEAAKHIKSTNPIITAEELAKVVSNISLEMAKAAVEATFIPPSGARQRKEEPYSAMIIDKCRKVQLERAAEFFGSITWQL